MIEIMSKYAEYFPHIKLSKLVDNSINLRMKDYTNLLYLLSDGKNIDNGLYHLSKEIATDVNERVNNILVSSTTLTTDLMTYLKFHSDDTLHDLTNCIYNELVKKATVYVSDNKISNTN